MSPKTKQSEPAIRVDGLRKVFRTGFRMRAVVGLEDASFTVPRGCIFGLVGPNGAGKTTTIKIIMGLLRATRGQAWLDGQRVPRASSRARVGFLPELPSFYDHLKPLEFLGFAGALYGMSGRSCRKRAQELLCFVGLEGAVKKPIRKFSKGMMQRLGIAQSLIHDPEILLLDEPQSGLDPVGRKEIRDMILNLKKRGRTVFFSSHILPDVEDVCDEIAVMMGGRIRDIGAVGTVLNPRVAGTEVEVTGIDENTSRLLCERASRWTREGEALLLHFAGEVDSRALFRQVDDAGGVIVRLIPQRERLEDLFVREMARAEEAG